MTTVTLGSTLVGDAHRPYVIAEIGANHNGDMDLCGQLIDAAAGAGADAVKFQSWTATSLISEEEYQRDVQYSGERSASLRDMVQKYQLSPEQHRAAQTRCKERGIAFCSSPFSPEEADLLEELDVPFFKIASMDVTYLPFLRYVAQKQRPIVLSTGMASLGDIEQAIHTIRDEGNEQIVLLHCVSIYPTPPELANLRNISMLKETFGVPVGFSDHSLGTSIPLAAIALGACLIEKHFTVDKTLPGWDHSLSADPDELHTIVAEGRNVHTALGQPQRIVSEAEIEKRAVFRRSLIARHDLQQGAVLTAADVDFKRPGTGIPPDALAQALGRTLGVDKKGGSVLRWEDLA